jgi:RNA polymerase sigma-70 factor (ECF subfamily)
MEFRTRTSACSTRTRKRACLGRAIDLRARRALLPEELVALGLRQLARNLDRARKRARTSARDQHVFRERATRNRATSQLDHYSFSGIAADGSRQIAAQIACTSSAWRAVCMQRRMPAQHSLARRRGLVENAELLARLRAGDDAAFEWLVRAHTPRLLTIARRLLSSDEDAQDVVQEAFVSAFRGIESFQGDARLSTWLHRITVNAALMKRRAQSRRRDRDIESLLPQFGESGRHLEPPSTWVEDSSAAAERSETRALVRACIDDLPDGYRTVLILRDIQELETDEIARHLRITANAAKIRLHRARQALKTLLDPHMRGGGA